jgi:branched-chain amino acid transport system substrate-binding protein
MRADLWRVARLLAVTALVVAASGCGGGERPIRIGLLTECQGGLFGGYEDAMLAGAELPLLNRGARLTNGKPSGGVSGARVAGRDVELVRGCAEVTVLTPLVEEARRLVELEGVDAIVGPWGIGEGFVVKELARRYPEVAFVLTRSDAQEVTLRNPVSNVYRFDSDIPQGVGGLGAYAYNELGWRTAAVLAEDYAIGWYESAAFVAEFCSLGGRIAKSVYAVFDPAAADRVPTDVDGVALLISAYFSSPEMIPRLARRLGGERDRMVVGRWLIDDPGFAASAFRHLDGVVGASWIPPAQSTSAMREYRRAFVRAFPGLPGKLAESPIVMDFHDSMEGVLRGLEDADGRLGEGRRRLHEALSHVRLELPTGPVRLDENRHSVRQIYLKRILVGDGGRRADQLVRVVPGVEQSFGGLLSKSPPPRPGSQPCRKATPPPWAR